MIPPDPDCGYCQGGPVYNAAGWSDGHARPPAACPRCGGTFPHVRFLTDDGFRQWRAGDAATWIGCYDNFDRFRLPDGVVVMVPDAFGRGFVEVAA